MWREISVQICYTRNSMLGTIQQRSLVLISQNALHYNSSGWEVSCLCTLQTSHCVSLHINVLGKGAYKCNLLLFETTNNNILLVFLCLKLNKVAKIEE